MARYRGPKCKLCRREQQKLFLKGDKCTTKCILDRRPEPPGRPGAVNSRSAAGMSRGRGRGRGGRGPSSRGRSSRGRVSDYAIRLREKQKLRRIYGVLERQFRLYFKRAAGMHGVTGDNLLALLERRLDNVVYRMGLATSRAHARQLVTHRHLNVNGRPVDVPSMLLQPGDTIELRQRSLKHPVIRELLDTGKRDVPSWLERAGEGTSARVVGVPTRDQIDTDVQEQLIVEYYSR